MKNIFQFLLPIWLTANSMAQVIIIDPFELPAESDAVVANKFVPADLSSQESADIIAPLGETVGKRFLLATLSGPAGAPPGTYATTAFTHNAGEPTESYLTLAARSGADSGTSVSAQSSISWGSQNELNQDFSSLGTGFQFLLTITSSAISGVSGGQIPVTLALANNGGGSHSVAVPLTSGGSSTISWSSLDFPLLDFTNLDSIEIRAGVTLARNSEFSILLNDFRAIPIPEPGTAAFYLVGLGALATRRRRSLQ